MARSFTDQHGIVWKAFQYGAFGVGSRGPDAPPPEASVGMVQFTSDRGTKVPALVAAGTLETMSDADVMALWEEAHAHEVNEGLLSPWVGRHEGRIGRLTTTGLYLPGPRLSQLHDELFGGRLAQHIALIDELIISSRTARTEAQQLREYFRGAARQAVEGTGVPPRPDEPRLNPEWIAEILTPIGKAILQTDILETHPVLARSRAFAAVAGAIEGVL